jgi:cystine transport system permease protein
MTDTWSIVVASIWPILRASLVMTLPISLAAFSGGLLLGGLIAIARLSRWGWLRAVAWFYVWVWRGTPLLVQLYIVFFGLPSVGLTLDPLVAAVITLALNTGAFCSETIRATILAVNVSQWQSASALGLGRGQVLVRVILPQAFANALPPLGNTFIGLVKETSLLASITVVELFRVAQQIAARTYEILPLYMLAAVVYLMYSTVLTWLQGKLETRLSLA